VEHDDRALFWRKTPERKVEQFAISDERRDIGDGRAIDREELDFDRPATAAPKHIDTGTDDETAKPRLEAIRIAKSREVPPSSHEAVLDGVPGELVVSEDQSGGRIQPRDEREGQHTEGVMIASLRSLDEFPLVHGHPL
jgi:hypothetical protein